MRDHEHLVKMCDAADLHGEIFTAFGVHIGRRLVEKGDADVR